MIQLTEKGDYHKGQLARAIPGAEYDGSAGSWMLEDPSARAASIALRLFPQLGNAYPELVELRDSSLEDVRPTDYAAPYGQSVENALSPAFEDNLEREGIALHEYQSTDLGYALRYLEQCGAFYIGWERGLGKTLASCVLVDALNASSVMVVAPNTAKLSVWATAVERFLPDHEVIVLGNSEKQRARALEQAQDYAFASQPFVLVVHYEALAVIAGTSYRRKGDARKRTISRAEYSDLAKDAKADYKRVIGDEWARLGITWDLVVADEAHRFGNPDTLMTKAMAKVPRDKLVLLSGSVIQNKLEELYSPLHLMFPDRYKSKWRDWNDRYLDYVKVFGNVCLGIKAGREQALRDELGAFMVVRRKADEIDLPERTDVTELLPLSSGQRKHYDELAAECITFLEDDTKVMADVGIAMLGKLRQIATGLDLLTGEVSDSTKLDRAVEIITDAEDDVFVVFSWYKSAVHALAERLAAKGTDSFVITGDTKHQDRDKAIAEFQGGKHRVLIGTLATMGESVNLQRANNVIMLDRSWNPALNEQAEDRVHRQGQTRKTTITHLVAEGTVDELNVMPTLGNKAALRAAVLGVQR